MDGLIAVLILLVVFSPAILAILTKFLLQWKQAGGGETKRLQQDLAELRRDYEQLKAAHNDMLLGLNAGLRRLEDRVDAHVGIDAPAPDADRRPAAQRQL